MKITNITYPNSYKLSCKRAPSEHAIVAWNKKTEAQDYADTIKEAKDFLGIKKLSLILHQSNFPVKYQDTFIGSHLNNKAIEVNKFLKMHGFDSIQLGPPGLTKLSPYTSSVNSKNYLYTDFNKLETNEYAAILSPQDLEKVSSKLDPFGHYEKDSDETDFSKAFIVADTLYKKAYSSFLRKTKAQNPQALKLQKEFEIFKKSNAWLEKDAFFVLQRNLLGISDDFTKWPDINKNLFEYKADKSSNFHNDAKIIYNSLYKNFGNEIELYKFKQFIIDKQEKEFKANKEKLTYDTDAIIGFHLMDYYANKDAFLPDYRVGTPYGGEGRPQNGSIWGNNQTWGIPVLNPKKLFTKDENGNITGLGIAGQLLRQKFENLLENYDSIRIDHVIGLVDPWIYNKNNIEIKQGLYPEETPDTPEHIIYKNANGANISMFHKENVYGLEKGWGEEITKKINESIKNMPDIDPDGDYAKILDYILIPLFKEKNVKPEDMVWETLGCDTEVFNLIFNKERNGKYLPEITSSYQWQIQKRLSNPRHKNNTVLLGSHDHPPFAQVCSDKFYKDNNCKNGIYEENYIVGSLFPELNNEERGKIMGQLSWDKRLRVKLKFAEMFRYGEKIQLSFMDFFGLDKTYNYSGTENPKNWKLRLKNNYKTDYYNKLAWKPGDTGVDNVALNMPELLKRSIIAKIKTEKNGDFNSQKSLIDRLDYYEKILKEPI